VLIGAPFGPVDGTTQLPGQQAGRSQVGVARGLVAEAATDVVGDEAELRGRDAKRAGDPADRGARSVTVAGDRELSCGGIPFRERGRAFERRRGKPVEVELRDANYVIGRVQGALDVAVVEPVPEDDVGSS